MIAKNNTGVICRQLGNVRILAKTAPQIASHGSDGVGPRSRQKMEKGLFLDRIDMTGDNPAVYQRIQYTGLIFPDLANAASSRFYNTAMGAQMALYFIVGLLFIQIGFHFLFTHV
jgi:hypothetical protein